MKNYDEIAQGLFERRDEYLKEQKIKKAHNKRIILSVSAVLAVAVIGTGIWKSGFFTSANIPEAESLEAKQKKTEIISGTIADSAKDAEKITSVSGKTKKDSKDESYFDSVENGKTTTLKAENKTQKSGNDTASTAENEKTTTAKAEKKTQKKNNDTASSASGDIISSFEGDASYGMPCYVMPGNGEYTLSYPVRWSVDKYGSTKKYRLGITITKNGNGVTDAEKNAELNRLKKAGCDIKKYTLMTYAGEDAHKEYYTKLGGIFTKEQLETLFTGREYGYFFDFMANGDGNPADDNSVSDGSEFFEKTTKKGENYISAYN